MSLPLPVDYAPMEADTAREIPSGPEWEYEPKWDGFRCLAFRDGTKLDIMSKSGQPLARYFPEIKAALLSLDAEKFVIDGELIVTRDRTLSFDDLLQRIHPAESRIKNLSQETPATLMVFDLLVNDRGADLSNRVLDERRTALEQFAAKYLESQNRIRLSPRTRDFDVAKAWFKRMAGPLDGIIAKRVDRPYASGERISMLKIKNLRTADCVVGGFRYGTKQKLVGSLLLGLYDDAGLLNHVGFTSGLAAAEKPALTKRLEALKREPGFTGSAPGGPSRWSTERSGEWEPLAPELVVEVQYDHFSGDRFRHGTKLLRWRPEKAPEDCTLKQVRRESESPLTLLS
ncbi:MAG: ATP-dependent DNA ligase [Acidobacteriaceae bacterium]|nr:ATP-dependent DNA ligase [Acidobacteriaceae bacterium]MBV9782094.1 ATP-dependent DNA ligase [Acidobacteriaceae bacterium]